MASDDHQHLPLFETRRARGRIIYRVFAATVFTGICLIWAYRLSYIPRKGEDGRWVWLGLLAAELWFGLYWVVTQALRWNQVYRLTFKDRLSHRLVSLLCASHCYFALQVRSSLDKLCVILLNRYENELPGVDIFVCTADPTIEPPVMVINTVLSVMAYDYPSEKLGIYLSDDGGSQLTFFALFEACKFARYWIPYCKKFNVGPRSPAAYFVSVSGQHDSGLSQDLDAIKVLILL